MGSHYADADFRYTRIPDDVVALYCSGVRGPPDAGMRVTLTVIEHKTGIVANVLATASYSRAEDRGFRRNQPDRIAAAIGRRTLYAFPSYLNEITRSLEQAVRTEVRSPPSGRLDDARPWHVQVRDDPLLTMEASRAVYLPRRSRLPLSAYVRELLQLLPHVDEARISFGRKTRRSR